MPVIAPDLRSPVFSIALSFGAPAVVVAPGEDVNFGISELSPEAQNCKILRNFIDSNQVFLFIRTRLPSSKLIGIKIAHEPMQALALQKYGPPSTYESISIATPTLGSPDDILIKVHAASINPVDVKFAAGMIKAIHSAQFPYKIGLDVAGTVVAVGTAVTTLKVGDEVYSRVPNHHRGTVAEYALSTEGATALKPPSLGFQEAASIPLAGLTALQCMEYADKQLSGGLQGKTVLIPAGLGGTGSFAVQLAQNVYKAGRVITTLSTNKIPKAAEFFGEGVIDFIDYTKDNVLDKVGRGTVDYFFDTMGATREYLPVMKPGGVIVSISTIPSGVKMRSHAPQIPFVMEKFMNTVDWFNTWWCNRSGVHYTYIFMKSSAADLDALSKHVADAKLKPLVGKVASFQNMAAVREGCQEIFDAKGGLGKFVIGLS
ncbi:NADPH-dependent alkenal/one oxidoreductase, chloroplastic [Paramyrothecium foliicola]|nr:NADPH-dependent alkenal/one oxidoreductase, chloroplastic [Paramyrothecium foliicola]